MSSRPVWGLLVRVRVRVRVGVRVRVRVGVGVRVRVKFNLHTGKQTRSSEMGVENVAYSIGVRCVIIDLKGERQA